MDRQSKQTDKQTGEILETQHTGKAEFCKDGWKEELRNRQTERYKVEKVEEINRQNRQVIIFQVFKSP
jgi:hypothetical protein